MMMKKIINAVKRALMGGSDRSSTMMKQLTMDERTALVLEINKLLATIPDYQLTMPESEMEDNNFFITDQGYVQRHYFEKGDISDDFIGETREEAIATLAHKWIVKYSRFTSPKQLWPSEENLTQFDKIKRFRAHCDANIFKNINLSLNNAASADSAAFDVVNQKAAAILQKITAYDVRLDLLENDTSYATYWYKKEGERWVYYTLWLDGVRSSIEAENDDEMVYNVVWRSLGWYATHHFVILRERNGKDPYRKYDDFMEECLHIVYPDRKYRRLPEYDDAKYAAQDAEFKKLLRSL